MSNDKKRWLILALGILVNICQGGAYAFGVFRAPLAGLLGVTPKDPGLALAFSLMLACLPVGMLLSGKIVDKSGPKLVILVGGLVLGAGFFLSGFTSSFMWLWITMGVMTSLGSGMAYGAVVSTAVRWFPDRRGLASGLAVSALGIGTLIISGVAPMIMGPDVATDPSRVLVALKTLGVIFTVVIAASSFLMASPPAGYLPEGFVPKATGTGSIAPDVSWTTMVGTGRFWFLFVMYLLGVAPGFMLLPSIKALAEPIMAPALTLLVTGIVAGLSNSFGRMFWGAVSDKLTRIYAIVLMFAVSSAFMFLMPIMMDKSVTMVPAMVLVLLCYGGYLGIFPSLCAESFGGKNMSVNYGVLFISFSISGLLAPQVMARVDGPVTAFMIAGIVAFVGMAFAIAGLMQERATVAAK